MEQKVVETLLIDTEDQSKIIVINNHHIDLKRERINSLRIMNGNNVSRKNNLLIKDTNRSQGEKIHRNHWDLEVPLKISMLQDLA